jgi:hypothetical protein
LPATAWKSTFCHMRTESRWLFRLEVVLAAASAFLTIITVLWRDWIEIVFGVDPDQHSGELEWLIVGAFLVATLALVGLALFERRRQRRLATASGQES